MDENINHSVFIAVVVVLMTIVIGFIASNLSIGRDLYNRFERTLETYLGLTSGELKELSGSVEDMNSAAAQGIVLRNKSDIDIGESLLSVYATSNGTSFMIDLTDVHSTMYGNVWLQVDRGDSGYIVTVHNIDCSYAKLNGTGICTCVR